MLGVGRQPEAKEVEVAFERVKYGEKTVLGLGGAQKRLSLGKRVLGGWWRLWSPSVVFKA